MYNEGLEKENKELKEEIEDLKVSYRQSWNNWIHISELNEYTALDTNIPLEEILDSYSYLFKFQNLPIVCMIVKIST